MKYHTSMSDLEQMQDSDIIPVEAVATEENLFKPLVKDATSTLRRLMLNTSNEKIARETAESILDRAGETKREAMKSTVAVQISDSQINVLMTAAKEAFNE